MLAVLAILISLADVAYTVWARPRPHFAIEWQPDRAAVAGNDVMVAVCWIWNDGDATARNVRLRVVHPRIECARPFWERWHEFEPGRGRQFLEIPIEPSRYETVGLNEWALRRLDTLPEGLEARDYITVWERAEVLRPIVELRYRGRLRPVRWKVPAYPPLPSLGGC